MARVALLLVSHSAAAAEGAAEIARQMAPDVEIVAAGGNDGGIGTSADLVQIALERLGAGLVTTGWEPLRDGAGVVVLTDLGSAVLTTEMVLELVDDALAALVRVPNAPFVEGAVMAAVQAQQDGDLDEVSAAAVSAGHLFAAAAAEQDVTAAEQTVTATEQDATATERDATATEPASDDQAEPASEDRATGEVTLPNPQGLHARPAAVLASAIADLGVPVQVDGADGSSILALLQLGAVGGQQLSITAAGEGATEAVDSVVALIAEGFGEAPETS